MATGYQALTEKEKQALRLIVRGHDAKSTARHLGLSVHTVNERLRDARRKLEVSSSREAARLVLDTEGDTPENLGDKQIGEAAARNGVGQHPAPGTGERRPPVAAWAVAGVVIMSIILGLLALSVLSDGAAPSAARFAPAEATVAASESEVVRDARDWLELGDQERWKDAWAATGSAFRTLNSLERWTAVAKRVRVPLGTVVSRTALSQESVPAPPAGVEVVKFRTDFANRTGATETVSLAREGGDWRVVGITID